MSDGQALYAACLQSPQEDTPRLVYADWLEEQKQERVTCAFCHGAGRVYPGGTQRTELCGKCDGSGTALDTSSAERAEYIRAAVALEREPLEIVAGVRCPVCDSPGGWRRGVHFDHERICSDYGPCYKRSTIWEPGETIANPKRLRLKSRADELLAANRQRWETLPCPEYPPHRSCPVCSGAGDLLQVPPVHRQSTARQVRPVTWSRGFPSVSCTSGEVWQHDRVIAPAGTLTREPFVVRERIVPTAWAKAVSRWAVGFVLTDREPDCLRIAFRWWCDSGGPTASCLPQPLYILTRNQQTQLPSLYPTRENAIDALAAAVGQWVRGQEGKS